ncbi:MAG: NAD(P)H-dependent oxidoreductase [Clostridiales bacterium]|jgi:multimeric flavodoxin WrbA|nr:NAD(P)H-dependent oxidoreductase [Clostridiales bacterium]
MNYLLINGSPHKGNTWILAERIKSQILALSPQAVFDEIHLTDINLPFCTGCSLCFRKGHEYCPHHKTVRDIIDKIDLSDGVIFTTSTFNMQPAALTKNLIDHLCFMLHRPYFFTKKAVVITTTGGIGANKSAKYLAGMLRGIGFNRCGELPVTSHSWNAYKVADKTAIKCAKAAKAFDNDVSSKKMHPPTASLLIFYNLMRGMGMGCVKGTEYATKDGEHWTDPVRINRFYDAAIPVPFYKKPLGALFFLMGKLSAKFITVTYRK